MARIPLTHDYWRDGCQFDVRSTEQEPLGRETRDDEWRGDPAELDANVACERSEAIGCLRDQVQQWKDLLQWTSDLTRAGIEEVKENVVGWDEVIVQLAIDGASHERSLILTDCANAPEFTPSDSFHLNDHRSPVGLVSEDAEASGDYLWTDLSRSYASAQLAKAAHWLEALSRSLDSPRIGARRAGTVR
jgi:hypothetical protein